MKSLEDKIRREGTAIGTEIVKVDGFLNHQIDVAFLEEIGEEFKKRFAGKEVNKILTIEASGIAIGAFVSRHMGYVPLVFAKKTQPNTLIEDCYTCDCRSFTKGTVSTIRVSKRFLGPDDKVLIIDDFLAHGEAGMALANVVEQAGGKVVGIGAVIEKSFAGGSAKLREAGYRVESLAVIKSLKDGEITFE